MKLKRAFFLVFLASLTLSVFLGVLAILNPDFLDWVGGELIITALTIALFGFCAFGATIVRERNVWRLPMFVCYTLCVIGVVVYLVMIWGERRWFQYNHEFSEVIGMMMFVIAIWTIALPTSGLINFVPFKNKAIWLRHGTVISMLVLAVGVSAGAIGSLFSSSWLFGGPYQTPWWDDWFELIWKFNGIFALITLAGLISVPIVYKMQRIDRDLQTETTKHELQITCPRCALSQVLISGYSRCTRCRLKFHIEIEEPRCPECNYLLHNLMKPVCPECGTSLSGDEVVTEMVETSV